MSLMTSQNQSVSKPEMPASLFFPVNTVSRGAGEVVIKPGRPLSKLTAHQLAGVFGVDRETVYRWRSEGLIERKYVSKAGKRKLLFDAAVIDVLQKKFNELHQ